MATVSCCIRSDWSEEPLNYHSLIPKAPIWSQGGTAIQTTAQHTQQIFQCFRIQRERTFPGTSLAVTYRHVAGIDIADLFRQDDLQPVAVRADHLHGRSVGKLGEGGIIHSSARADIQIAAARGDGAGLPGAIFAGTELDTILGDGYRDLAACQSGKQIRDIPSRFLFSHGLRAFLAAAGKGGDTKRVKRKREIPIFPT